MTNISFPSQHVSESWFDREVPAALVGGVCRRFSFLLHGFPFLLPGILDKMMEAFYQRRSSIAWAFGRIGSDVTRWMLVVALAVEVDAPRTGRSCIGRPEVCSLLRGRDGLGNETIRKSKDLVCCSVDTS